MMLEKGHLRSHIVSQVLIPPRRGSGLSMPISPLVLAPHLTDEGAERKGSEGSNMDYVCKSRPLT